MASSDEMAAISHASSPLSSDLDYDSDGEAGLVGGEGVAFPGDPTGAGCFASGCCRVLHDDNFAILIDPDNPGVNDGSEDARLANACGGYGGDDDAAGRAESPVGSEVMDALEGMASSGRMIRDRSEESLDRSQGGEVTYDDDDGATAAGGRDGAMRKWRRWVSSGGMPGARLTREPCRLTSSASRGAT